MSNYNQISNFWENSQKDSIIFGSGPIGLWSAILLLEFNRINNVIILEKRFDNDMWLKRNYIVKINNGYLKQISDIYIELNKNKKSENKKKDNYSMMNLSFEKILDKYTKYNKFIDEYTKINPDPRKINQDQDFYAINNIQILLKKYLDKKYSDRYKIISFSETMLNYKKENNMLALDLYLTKNIDVKYIIDCTGVTSFIMNKTLGVEYDNKKSINYGVGLKIYWNKTNIKDIYEKQQKLLKINNDDKYIYYTIKKENISNIEFEDLHSPKNILNAKVLFAECFDGQDNLLLNAGYDIDLKSRKSSLPFKKSISSVDSTFELLCNKEKFKNEIGYYQRDALRLFWYECVRLYNDITTEIELKNNILSFFILMKKSGVNGINGYKFIKYLSKIKILGSIAIISYIINHLNYCRFIPEINKNEDITSATDIYVIDNNGKNMKKFILSDIFQNIENFDNIQLQFIYALKEINITFVPDRTERLLKKNLVNIDLLKIGENKNENIKIFAIGDSLFTTDFSLGMGVNRGLSEAIQIIRDGISPQRIRNEINKYVHQKNLPKSTDHKLLYNINSNNYFFIETILPHKMIQKKKKKNKIFTQRKLRLKWRKQYMKYIISLLKNN
jgi:hypothetical protein